MSVNPIGRSKKMDKLPSEMVNVCLNACSIIPPKIKAKINGAAGNEKILIKNPTMPKISNK